MHDLVIVRRVIEKRIAQPMGKELETTKKAMVREKSSKEICLAKVRIILVIRAKVSVGNNRH